MDKDAERNQSIRDALASTNLQGSACFSPVNVLLLSGYWPVMGSSVAIFQRDGRVTVLLPEDEMELAEATSDAELLSYYWTDISRTYIVGTPNKQQECMTAPIAEARTAGLNAVVPGVEARQIDAAARNVLTRYGYGDAFKHSTGHGVGFAAADPNAQPRVHPASRDVLKEGMTFNIEPAIYIEGIGGMRHCDLVACTSSGANVLTDF
jgi:hypothetical protein